MPLYEYRCTKCGHRFEKIQKFSDPHVKKCPKCKGKVEQLLSSPAVHFKGTGWYVTDYAAKGAGASKDKEESVKPEEKKADEKKPDEKKPEETKKKKDDKKKKD